MLKQLDKANDFENVITTNFVNAEFAFVHVHWQTRIQVEQEHFFCEQVLAEIEQVVFCTDAMCENTLMDGVYRSILWQQQGAMYNLLLQLIFFLQNKPCQKRNTKPIQTRR